MRVRQLRLRRGGADTAPISNRHAPGREDAHVIAVRMTLAIWRTNTGGDAQGGFNRRLAYRNLAYPNLSVV